MVSIKVKLMQILLQLKLKDKAFKVFTSATSREQLHVNHKCFLFLYEPKEFLQHVSHVS